MSTTMVSMCLDVRGAINNILRSRSKRTGFQHSDGRSMTRDEAVMALIDELAKGHEVIPMNPKCGNPCQNSPLCKGFDHGKDGGCPGYPVIEVDPGLPAGDMTSVSVWPPCTCLTGQLGPDYCERHSP